MYDEDAWARLLPYHELPTDLALDLLETYRRYTYEYLARVSEDTWESTILHPESGTMTLHDVLRLYANHIDEHIRQIDLTVDAWQRHQRGEPVDTSVSFWSPLE